MRRRTSGALRPGLVALAIGVVAAIAPVPSASAADAPYTIRAGSLRIGLDSTGTVTGLVDTVNGRDYASADHHAPLIKLVVDGAQQLPTSLSYDGRSSTYVFGFGGKGVTIGVQVASKAGYATLEVTSVNAPAGVDVQTLLWGPITTSITQTVGETVGVVRDNDFAIGIHGLNDKSVGGWPDEYDNLTYTDGPAKSDPSTQSWAYGWFSADQTSWGSILQAYTYDYTKTRHRYVGWQGTNEPDVAVPPLSGDDALIKGSKIALFGTDPGNVLNTLSDVETGEGLLHPKIDGQWEKTSQGASQSFLVLSDLNTNDVGQASAYAKQGGMRYVYSLPNSEGPWQSTGHYQFDSSFGSSDAAAAKLAATAATSGVSVGVHTLSNTVDTWDRYVTPVPDPGLATAGSVTLTRPLDATSKTVYVDGNSIFTGGSGNIRIGNELLSFTAVTKVADTANEYQVTLTNRGGWGTTAAAHPAGADLARMQWYAYGQFDAGMTMLPGLADRLAQIWNTTGIKAMSFDGLETATLAGYGTFGTNKLVNGMYRKIGSTDDFISEASNLLPGTWDATGRISWGEGSHGTTYTGSLLAHQAYYQRNYMPNMMGWVTYHSSDSVLTQEWQLSKNAAWNAGAGLQASVSALKASGDTAEVLDAWKQWEAARNAHAFTTQQMDAMKDAKSYWHLETVHPGKEWNLYNVEYPASTLNAPNNGSSSSWTYTNTHDAQPLQFQLQASGGNVTDPSFTLGGQTVTFHTTVPSGGYLVADGTATAKVYDSTWHQLSTVTAQGAASYTAGDQTIAYNATGSTGSTAKIRFLTYSAPQAVKAPVTIDAPSTVQRGGTGTVTATYTNPGTTTLRHAALSLTVPKGWTAEATTGAGTRGLAPGETMTMTWHVTPPADAKPGGTSLVAQATYDGARTSAEAIADVSVPNPLSIATPALAKPGATATVTTTYTNGGSHALPNTAVKLAVPDGWTATAATPATFPTLDAGQTATTTWNVTVPADAKAAAYPLTATATYQGAPVTDEADGQTTVPYSSLPATFNNAGISDDSNPAGADFDGGGRSISAQTLAAAGLTPGAQVSHDGLTFTWPDTTPGAPDNVTAKGQAIAMTGTGATLGFLATSGGDASGTGTITYTDGTTQAYTLAISDWTSTTPAPGSDILATLPHRNASRGGVTNLQVNVYAATVALRPGKTVAYVALPNASGMHIFSTAIG
ncbi:NEW3 domain-containing protein [Streptomyces sp. NPDC020917]|uniref:NEW3 domain-containing protein n=1 Tax=Streptomyces sp. NPDC020917 TaxID=3365102 RepID=UPI0037B05B89